MKKTFESFTPCLELREVVFLKTLPHHAHLVPALDIFLDPYSKKLHIAMEYMEGNLYQLMKARDHKCLDNASVKSILFQIMQGLEHIHAHHFFHRDIKPENILVGTHGEIKISDFGWSVHAPNNRRNTMCGTLDYLPPEMLKPGKDENWYNEKVDLWSLGVLTYEFLVGEAPFEDTPSMTQKRIARGEMTIPPFVSAEAKDLIKKVCS